MVDAHQRVVASFDAGLTARATTNANATSRSGHAGPNSLAKPTFSAIAHTAATCPCGKDRSISQSDPASTRVLPANDARITSIVSAGNAVRLDKVSWRILPSSRQLRRKRCDTYSRVSPSRVVYLRTILAT